MTKIHNTELDLKNKQTTPQTNVPHISNSKCISVNLH